MLETKKNKGMHEAVNAISEIAVLLRNGKSVRQSAEVNGLPITRIETIADGTINPAKVGFADLEESDCADWLLQDGDILISHINSTKHLGKCAIYEGDPPALIHGMNLLALRVDPDVAASRYVYWMLSSTGFRRKLPRITKDSVNQSSFNIASFKKLQIPLPPLPQQKRIAWILDAADALRAKRREAIAHLDALLQSTFLDMFGDPVTNPMGWDTSALGAVGEVITGNTPSRKRPEYYGEDIEWIKSDNINDPSFVLTEAEERLSVVGKAVARTSPKGSILVTCIAGSPSCIGNAAIADREVAFNQQINAFVPGERVSLWLAFGVFWVGKRLVQSASTNSMKGMVSKSAFSAISIPIPPTSLQSRFAAIAESVGRQKARQRAHLAELDTLFASLQSRAFRGEL